MTVHLTLPSSAAPSSSSAGLSSAGWSAPSLTEAANEAGLRSVASAIRAAKRVVFLTGAGVSVAAGIPDFRSSHGLFKTLGDDSGGVVKDGKDLFDVSALNTPTRASLHHRMLASLYQLAEQAEPTAFHRMLRDFDEQGRLLRVYTQNIDNLEERTGLTQGIPVTPPRPPRATERRKTSHADDTLPLTPASTPSSSASTSSTPSSTSSATSPVPPTPRSIPLHGLLTSLICPLCPHTTPMSDHLELLASGPTSIPCFECKEADEIRSVASLRSRGIGRMRAGVVLYGEEHPRGEDIGRVVERDLKGSRAKKGNGGAVESEGKADLLVVVGTSLVVPGMRTLVREFGRVVGGGKLGKAKGKKSASLERAKTVLINLTPLAGVPGAKGKAKAAAEVEEGGFDVFIQGDVQTFVTEYLNMVHDPPPQASIPSPAKSIASSSSAGLVFLTTPERRAVPPRAYMHNLPTPPTPFSPWSTPVLKPLVSPPPPDLQKPSLPDIRLSDFYYAHPRAPHPEEEEGLVSLDCALFPTPSPAKREADREESVEVESPSKKPRAAARPKNWEIIGVD